MLFRGVTERVDMSALLLYACEPDAAAARRRLQGGWHTSAALIPTLSSALKQLPGLDIARRSKPGVYPHTSSYLSWAAL